MIPRLALLVALLLPASAWAQVQPFAPGESVGLSAHLNAFRTEALAAAAAAQAAANSALPLSGGAITGTLSAGTASTNFIQLLGGASNPTITVAGAGSDGALLLQSQGHGAINMRSTTGGLITQFADTSAGTVGNFLKVTGRAAGNAVLVGSSTADGISINTPLNLTRAVVYSGTATTVGNVVLGGVYNYTGTGTDVGTNALNTLKFNDGMVNNGATTYFLNASTSINAGSSGPRTSFQASINQTAVTANQANGGSPLWAAAQLFGTAGFSEGGVRTTVGIKGAVWGAVIGSYLRTGATNFAGNVGIEVDSNIETGASVGRNRAIQIVNRNNGTRGFYGDDAISFGSFVGSGSLSWLHGVAFGSSLDGAAFDTNSTYLYSEFPNGLRALTDLQAGWFADMQQPTFTGGLIRSRGYAVYDGGTTRIGTGIVKPTSTGLSIDAPGSLGPAVGATVNAASGGSGWQVGDLMRGANNGVYSAASAPGGVLATATVLVQPSIDSGSPPADPVTVTAFGASDGVGATLTLGAWDQTRRTVSIDAATVMMANLPSTCTAKPAGSIAAVAGVLMRC